MSLYICLPIYGHVYMHVMHMDPQSQGPGPERRWLVRTTAAEPPQFKLPSFPVALARVSGCSMHQKSLGLGKGCFHISRLRSVLLLLGAQYPLA